MSLIGKGVPNSILDDRDQRLLIIMRGLPGSGKSHAASLIQPSLILSTDDYFLNANGDYVFNVKLLSKAHAWNQKRALAAFKEGVNTIVIDNTNVRMWEAKPYAKMAKEAGYQIQVREPDTEWWKKRDLEEMAKKNLHGVSFTKLQQMLSNFEDSAIFTLENILASERPF